MSSHFEAICGRPQDGAWPADAIILITLIFFSLFLLRQYLSKRQNALDNQTDRPFDTDKDSGKALCPTCLHENPPDAAICEQCHAPFGTMSDIGPIMKPLTIANQYYTGLSRASKMRLVKCILENILTIGLIIPVVVFSFPFNNLYLDVIYFSASITTISLVVPKLMSLWKIPDEPSTTPPESTPKED